MTKTNLIITDGKVEKKANEKLTPWLPPEQMRSLPGEFITQDDTDHVKIHELDAPHIVNALFDEQVEALAEKPKDLVAAATGAPLPFNEIIPLNQSRVDTVIFRAIQGVIKGQLKLLELEEQEEGAGSNDIDLRTRHLRFPENNINRYELHSGTPPADSQLRKHEKGIRLSVDLFHWPQRIVDALLAAGVEVPDVQVLFDQVGKRIILQ